MKQLTKQEEAFAQYVAQHGDEHTSDAYRHAYKGAKSKKPTTTKTNAHHVKTRPHVAARIKELQARVKEIAEKEFEVDAKRMLKMLFEDVTADLADIIDDETGALKPVREWPLVWRTGLVAGIDVQELTGEGPDGVRQAIGQTQKVRLADRTKLKELLGKHVDVQAFNTDMKVKGDPDNPIIHRIERVIVDPK